MDDRGHRVILITGATDGLGLKVATDLAAKGYTLLHGWTKPE
ncbi:hypothetical protein [Geotalea sp. SG265]|nr:hypothetical protein [Geotalea sp. SG265]